jgi:alginate O-acetyltransferase complex protein AlgI
MNFVQIEFLWFMTIMFVAYWGLAWVPTQGRRLQNALLLIGSCVFYGWVHPRFLILLFCSAFTDFVASIWIERRQDLKQYILLVSFAVNLGLLGYFKYFNFFIENVGTALTLLGVEHRILPLDILLPVGISFYTFQSMSYTLDVYRGELKARTDPFDFFVYVMFFPQLVAGPIERAPNLLVQVERDRTFSLERTLSGLSLAMWGGFKKMCIADTIAPYIDKVFIMTDPSGPLIWAACIAFSIQIFSDFSAYTDIARGTGRMLGFELTENFRKPFLAASTPEFWQRWHISLSFWIRDYLLVPLLGAASRLTTFRFVWATVLTFVIIGFWHGASWNFILFGLWHGIWLASYTLIQRNLPEWVSKIPYGRPMAVVFHYFAVNVPGSMLFRETHVTRIAQYLQKNPFSATPDEWVATAVVLGFTLLLAVPLVISHFVVWHWLPKLEKSPWLLPLQTLSWGVFGVMMFIFYRMSSSDFIYFQF